MYKYLLGFLLIPSIALGTDNDKFNLAVRSLLTTTQSGKQKNENDDVKIVRCRTHSDSIKQRKYAQAQESKRLRNHLIGVIEKLGMPTAEDLAKHASSNENHNLSVIPPSEKKPTTPEQAIPLRPRNKRNSKEQVGCCALL